MNLLPQVNFVRLVDRKMCGGRTTAILARGSLRTPVASPGP